MPFWSEKFDNEDEDLKQLIATISYQIPEYLSSELKAFLSFLFKYESERPDMEAILSHPWVLQDGPVTRVPPFRTSIDNVSISKSVLGLSETPAGNRIYSFNVLNVNSPHASSAHLTKSRDFHDEQLLSPDVFFGPGRSGAVKLKSTIGGSSAMLASNASPPTSPPGSRHGSQYLSPSASIERKSTFSNAFLQVPQNSAMASRSNNLNDVNQSQNSILLECSSSPIITDAEINAWHEIHHPAKQVRTMKWTLGKMKTEIPAPSLFMHLHKTLETLKAAHEDWSLTFERDKDLYLFRCTVKRGEEEVLEFEAEVCKALGTHSHVLRIERVEGDKKWFEEVRKEIKSTL